MGPAVGVREGGTVGTLVGTLETVGAGVGSRARPWPSTQKVYDPVDRSGGKLVEMRS